MKLVKGRDEYNGVLVSLFIKYQNGRIDKKTSTLKAERAKINV
jgi:hypothetical protein